MIGEECHMARPGSGPNKTQPGKPKTTGNTASPQATAPLAVRTLPAPLAGQRRPFTGFDRERATYQRLKADLLARAEGKYVVIVGDEVVGPLGSHEEAERAGYDRFGLGPLYVKLIVAEVPVVEVTRLHHP
jgi:hypothetical protein